MKKALKPISLKRQLMFNKKISKKKFKMTVTKRYFSPSRKGETVREEKENLSKTTIATRMLKYLLKLLSIGSWLRNILSMISREISKIVEPNNLQPNSLLRCCPMSLSSSTHRTYKLFSYQFSEHWSSRMKILWRQQLSWIKWKTLSPISKWWMNKNKKKD